MRPERASNRPPMPMEPGPMRNSRIVRTLVVAGSAAALSILSLVSTVMAATGGGDFPRLR
jgi:hypothetical protein